MHSSYFENWYKKLSIKKTLIVFENDMAFEVLSRVTQGLWTKAPLTAAQSQESAGVLFIFTPD